MTAPARYALWILLLAAAAARLLLQTAALPPYAGMDEIYHVARLVFVQNESRNPTIAEPSVPRYLERSVRQTAGWQPAFGVIGERWPDVVRSGARPEENRLEEASRRSYQMPNYEAQHPSLYYTVAAEMAPRSSDLDALRAWRLLSAAFAIALVMVVGFIGWKVAGGWGILAAALLPSLPTWEALVARASNDAFACLLLALAVAATIAAPSRLPGAAVEGLAWGGAVAAKLYSWPAAILLPLFWIRQRAPARRMVMVLAISGAALAATLWDLGSRTRNPIGIFAFDPVARAAAEAPPIAWADALKTFVLTFAWTSGQHWNALTPVGLTLFLAPLTILAIVGLARLRGRDETALAKIAATAAAVFALAQAVKFFAYLRSARLEGLALPAGGKEGWYWYALAPLFVGVLLALILRALRPRVLALLFVAWIAIWDVTLHEGALFRDFAGWTSPATRGRLVRWGPLPERPPTDLTTMAVGPFAEGALALRAAHLLLLAAIAAIVLRRENEPSSQSRP
ncbi:MAG TPA: hypothetical protein VFV54_05440 [Thermoanaerobaculia bacterium]|nr:hypothetical protein [Thermoanaerobaculia bacterium]